MTWEHTHFERLTKVMPFVGTNLLVEFQDF